MDQKYLDNAMKRISTNFYFQQKFENLEFTNKRKMLMLIKGNFLDFSLLPFPISFKEGKLLVFWTGGA